MGAILQPGASYLAGISLSTFIMDATTDFVAFRRAMLGVNPILKVEVFINTKTGTPGDMGVVLCADNSGIPTISAGVPVDIGGASPTLVTLPAASVTTNSRLTVTFTNGYTPTDLEYVWVVFYPISGGTWDASNRYIFSHAITAVGIDTVDECVSTSIDTGANFSRVASVYPNISLLTTSDAYLPSMSSVCASAATSVDWDNLDNPDERGTAWTIPANTQTLLYGAIFLFRCPANTADYDLAAYLNDTLQGSQRTIDVSATEVVFPTVRVARQAFPSTPITINNGTGRVTIRPTDNTNGFRGQLIDCDSQARRESCYAFSDMWYCHRDGGAGSFTDDLTQIFILTPIVKHVAVGTSRGFVY